MKTTLSLTLFALLALPIHPQTQAPATPAPNASSSPLPATGAGKTTDAAHQPIPEQMTVDDLKAAFADLSNKVAEATTQLSLTKANLERQRDAWKKRAESAELALEEAKKLIAPTPTPVKKE